ncbi:ABC-type transport auxiliary lipoprotein family protein [Halomonas piscis]|uniref:ABC-type transport auxiliary lipoprotein family protein n=1 Tax=Halomonas piscis TaxID=3031727 RepID=A0ABY9Z2Q6_9GAMM|nr:ABC-type transport auxiliary lipoprotein family protein [Halomonas piscis]WNK21143.1 ABC-type transport auxiliary lipoprotein family protein [Halomonas piscis]
MILPARLSILLAVLMTLPACSLLPDQTPQRTFLLPATTQPAAPAPALDTTLRLETPRAAQLLASPRILVRPNRQEISVYAGTRWNDDAPALLRDRLIEAFRQDGRLATVVREGSRVQSDLTLSSDLGAFQSEYNGDQAPQAVIRLDVQLLDESNRKVVASRRFDVRQQSDSPQLESVVDAFGLAADKLATQLVDWVIANTNKN